MDEGENLIKTTGGDLDRYNTPSGMQNQAPNLMGGPWFGGPMGFVMMPAPRLTLLCGDSKGFVEMANRSTDCKAIIWNEGSISLMGEDRNTLLTFTPEYYPPAAMFFMEHVKLKRDQNDTPMRVWEGEFVPIEFSKATLIKFINENASNIVDAGEVIQSIKKMNVMKSKFEGAEMLDTDNDDNHRTVIEEKLTCSVPKSFKIKMPICENMTADLEFTVAVGKKTDRYGNVTDKTCLVLRCTNARKVLKGMMELILDRLPENVPRIYGKMQIGDGDKKKGLF
jgi:hypothetical protein